MNPRKAKTLLEALDYVDHARCRLRDDVARILCPVVSTDIVAPDVTEVPEGYNEAPNVVAFGITLDLMGAIEETAAFLRGSGVNDITGFSFNGNFILKANFLNARRAYTDALGCGEIDELGGWEAENLTFSITRDGIELVAHAEICADGRRRDFKAEMSLEKLDELFEYARKMSKKATKAAIEQCFGAEKKKTAPRM